MTIVTLVIYFRNVTVYPFDELGSRHIRMVILQGHVPMIRTIITDHTLTLLPVQSHITQDYAELGQIRITETKICNVRFPVRDHNEQSVKEKKISHRRRLQNLSESSALA